MDELEELRNAFNIAQQSSPSSFKLSEKSCVEIIFKLMQLRKISVISAVNGTEFVTLQKLETEILQALASAGDRINLVELSSNLGVSLDQVEVKVNELLRKHKKRLFLIQGDLMRASYMDNICEEINETLQESGQIFLYELSERYALPSDLLREEIFNRLNSSIFGTLHQQTLTSKTFDNRILACVRGTLMGACAPVSLSHIAISYNLEDDEVKRFTHKIIKDCVIYGRILNGIFYPKFYSDAQYSKVEAFFADNHYIPYDTVKESGIVNAQEYLTKRFPDGFAFKNTFVSRRLIDLIYAHMEDAFRNDLWVDVSVLLPMVLTASETEELVDALTQKVKVAGNYSPLLLGKSVFLSQGFLESIISKVTVLLKEKVKEAALFQKGNKQMVTCTSTETHQMIYEDESDSGISKKKNNAHNNTKKFKTRKKGKKKVADQDGVESLAVGGATNNTEMDVKELVMSDNFFELCGENWNGLVESVKPELLDYILKRSLKIYETLLNEAKKNLGAALQQPEFVSKSAALPLRFENFQFEVQSLQNLGLIRTGVPSSHPLAIYVWAKTLKDLVDPLIQICYFNKHELEVEVTTRNRAEIIERSTTVENPLRGLKKALECLSTHIVDNLVDAIFDALNDALIYVKRLNKKREKQLLLEQKHFWKRQLEESTPENPLRLFHTLLYFCITNESRLLPVFPCEIWSISAIWKIYESAEDFSNSNLSKLKDCWNQLNAVKALEKKHSDSSCSHEYQMNLASAKASLESEIIKVRELFYSLKEKKSS